MIITYIVHCYSTIYHIQFHSVIYTITPRIVIQITLDTHIIEYFVFIWVLCYAAIVLWLRLCYNRDFYNWDCVYNSDLMWVIMLQPLLDVHSNQSLVIISQDKNRVWEKKMINVKINVTNKMIIPVHVHLKQHRVMMTVRMNPIQWITKWNRLKQA